MSIDHRVNLTEWRLERLEKYLEQLERDLVFANQRLDELQSQVEALEER
jgi:hypothetical protein